MKETHMLLKDCSVAHAKSGSRLFNETESIFICTTYLHHTCAQAHWADGIRRMCLFGPSYSIAKKSCMICWNYALFIRNMEIEAVLQVGLHNII